MFIYFTFLQENQDVSKPLDLANPLLSVPEDCSISNPACFSLAVLWYFKYFKYYTYFNSSLPWPALLWYCSIAEEFQLGCPTTVAWTLPTTALQWPPLDIREGQATESWPFGRDCQSSGKDRLTWENNCSPTWGIYMYTIIQSPVHLILGRYNQPSLGDLGGTTDLLFAN